MARVPAGYGDAMNKNAEYPSMALQAAYNALMNENAALHKITTDLVYDVLAACSFRDDNSPAGLSLTVLYISPALDKARELVADAEDKEVEAMLK